MNLLNNKQLLRSLLKQGEILNTINGGSSLISARIVEHLNNIIVEVTAPGVSPNAFQVVVEGNQLIISCISTFKDGDYTTDQLLAAPMFFQKVLISDTVDKEKIEALFENNQLRVILPLKNNQQFSPKLIKIKKI